MGVLYHLAGAAALGQRRQRIYKDDPDRSEFLHRLEEMGQRYGTEGHGYVLMPNHYHLLVRTPKPNGTWRRWRR